MSRKFSISIVTETSKRTNRRSYSDIPSASNSPGVKNANRARFFASRIRGLSRPPLPSPDRFPRRGFEFRGSCGGGGRGRRAGATKISSNYVARASTNSRPNSRRRVGRVARFCFARRISSRNGGWMKLQRYWIALVLAPASDIRASPPPRPSVRHLARLRRYEIAVRNKNATKIRALAF